MNVRDREGNRDIKAKQRYMLCEYDYMRIDNYISRTELGL